MITEYNEGALGVKHVILYRYRNAVVLVRATAT